SLGIDSNALPVVNLALEQLERKRVQYFALDDAFQWSGAVCRVIAEFDEKVLRGNGQFQLYVPLSKATQQALDLDLHDLTQVIARQHIEDDGLVDTVQELGPECLSERLLQQLA